MRNPVLGFIAILAAACLLAAGSSQAELLAHFPFDGNADEIKNSLPVTVNGGGLTYASDGKFGQAAHFDGVDDYLDVGDGPNDVLEVLDGVLSSSATPPLAGTIMLWVRTTDTSTSNGSNAPTFVERRQPGTFKCLYKLSLGADEDFANLTYPPSKYADSNTFIADGQWHHIAVSMKRGAANTASYMYAYVDGYQKAAVALSEGFDCTLCEDLHIGGREKDDGSTDPVSFVETDIDELAVFDKYLTGAQIRDIMTYGVPEPGTLSLLGLGLFAALWLRKR